MARPSASTKDQLREFADAIDKLPYGDRVWVLPIYKALAESGGRAQPLAVEERVYKYFSGKLRDQQWAHVIRSKRIRFTRNELHKLGGMTDEKRVWEWTALGERYWRQMASQPLEAPVDWQELSDEETGLIAEPPETVEVTAQEGYEIPLLRLLAKGPLKRSEILAGIEQDLAGSMLSGDRRLATQGHPVFTYRVGWALTRLKGNGETKSPAHNLWEITDAGRARLKLEGEQWSLESYRGSKAKVRQLPAQRPHSPSPPPPPAAATEVEDDDDPAWHITMWTTCGSKLAAHVFMAADARLRPDLGPTPATTYSLARNLILYGPPGTGKTHYAREIARALTGEDEPSQDGRFRFVQFHPSYTYEDFIQGLRPDLSREGIHYRLQRGPLLRLCDDASDDPDRFYVLVIDEINRGDPARIFGEALFALEYRGRPVSLATGESSLLTIPPNVIVLGTMNSVDRSIALMDYALRRRFGFVHLVPDLEVVRAHCPPGPQLDLLLAAVTRLNDWLRTRLGPEYVLGHSFLLNPVYPPGQPDSVARIWKNDIEPLLEEYLVHERDTLAEVRQQWERWSRGDSDA